MPYIDNIWFKMKRSCAICPIKEKFNFKVNTLDFLGKYPLGVYKKLL